MVLSGRIKMNQTIGSGKLEVFDDLKHHFAADDVSSHISMFGDKKKVNK